MPFIDDRGRLFGRINIIDAAFAVFVMGLVPLAYVSYGVFKFPAPILISASPKVFIASEKQFIEVNGQHLRPLLRAYVGSTPATYLFENPDRAQVRLPALMPGAYDLIFVSDAQEVARMPRAITVIGRTATATATLTALGMFTGLEPGNADDLEPGRRLIWSGNRGLIEIVATLRRAPDVVTWPNGRTTVTDNDRLQALVRITGAAAGGDVVAGGVVVAPGAELVVPGPGTSPLLFVVENIYPSRMARVSMHVRFVVPSDLVDVVSEEMTNDQLEPEALRTLRPELVSIKRLDELPSLKAEFANSGATLIEGVVQLPALLTPKGWAAEGTIIRAGDRYTLTRPRYTLNGVIVGIKAP
jgi:hypothetical protein